MKDMNPLSDTREACVGTADRAEVLDSLSGTWWEPGDESEQSWALTNQCPSGKTSAKQAR